MDCSVIGQHIPPCCIITRNGYSCCRWVVATYLIECNGVQSNATWFLIATTLEAGSSKVITRDNCILQDLCTVELFPLRRCFKISCGTAVPLRPCFKISSGTAIHLRSRSFAIHQSFPPHTYSQVFVRVEKLRPKGLGTMLACWKVHSVITCLPWKAVPQKNSLTSTKSSMPTLIDSLLPWGLWRSAKSKDSSDASDKCCITEGRSVNAYDKRQQSTTVVIVLQHQHPRPLELREKFRATVIQGHLCSSVLCAKDLLDPSLRHSTKGTSYQHSIQPIAEFRNWSLSSRPAPIAAVVTIQVTWAWSSVIISN